MTRALTNRSFFPPASATLEWLLDSDPSVRWQVLQDIADAPAREVARERARIAREGFGARLLSQQEADGTWGGAAWNRGWNSTMHALTLLRDFGLDPDAPEARRALQRVRAGVTWRGCGPDECAANPFFAGELEPCINGQVAAAGAYFAQEVDSIIRRLLAEQLPDGGWNCDAPDRSARSSFNTTLCVLEALLDYERITPAPAVTQARLRGQDYLLARRLFRRLSNGAVIHRDRKGGADWTQFAFPTWWHYDLLRALDYLRRVGCPPDDRVADAIAVLVSKCDAAGRWPLDTRHPGTMPVELEESVGQPSRWNTLRALRVLRWYCQR